jgi:hypothetical protein
MTNYEFLMTQQSVNKRQAAGRKNFEELVTKGIFCVNNILEITHNGMRKY